MPDTSKMRARFAELHTSGCFIMPNAWDAGSARILAALGFPAIASTSSGHAASLGRLDQQVTLDELLEHAARLVAAIDVPVSIDAERCFADSAAGVAATIRAIAETGAAGVSIEDFDPGAGIDPLPVAVERVETAAEASRSAGMTLTARAENHLYGNDDLDDTIRRLVAYRGAGADVVYAPGLTRIDDIARLVDATGAPVNVLATPDGPSVPELEAIGVRRVSTGGALAFAAYGSLAAAAREIRDHGTSSYARSGLSGDDRRAAFDHA